MISMTSIRNHLRKNVDQASGIFVRDHMPCRKIIFPRKIRTPMAMDYAPEGCRDDWAHDHQVSYLIYIANQGCRILCRHLAMFPRSISTPMSMVAARIWPKNLQWSLWFGCASNLWPRVLSYLHRPMGTLSYPASRPWNCHCQHAMDSGPGFQAKTFDAWMENWNIGSVNIHEVQLSGERGWHSFLLQSFLL